jgi:hypothetical protein
VRERFIGVRHAMDVLFIANGRARIIGGVQNLSSEFLDHAASAALSGVVDHPADGFRGSAGMAFRNAWSKTSIAGRLARSSTNCIAE